MSYAVLTSAAVTSRQVTNNPKMWIENALKYHIKYCTVSSSKGKPQGEKEKQKTSLHNSALSKPGHGEKSETFDESSYFFNFELISSHHAEILSDVFVVVVVAVVCFAFFCILVS
jgi:hypothetical protein